MSQPQHIFKAFANAFNGMGNFFLHERNGKIQLSFAIVVIIAGYYFTLSATEWMFILLCIGAVISAEMMNSALEKLCDLVQKEYHPTIKIIKDVAAAAVLWFTIISVIIGIIIFLPKFIALL
jgi:undecaprenol kinase/diacylglycerol kinase (ATP)